MKKGWIWPVMIVASLLFTVGANVVMLMASSSDANGTVVEPDYYRKAVDWDRTMARRASSESLGWRAAVTLGATVASSAGDGRSVRLLLTDSTGAAVRGADVTVTLIHNLDAATPVRGGLAQGDEGTYDALLAVPRHGRWEVRVEARRAEDRFQATLHVDAP
jgi:nitrogen fixation protein FixH